MRDTEMSTHNLSLKQVNWLKNVATVYLQSGQYIKAMPLFQCLVTLNQNNSEPLKKLAYLHYRQDQFERALHCCQQIENNFIEPIDRRIYLLRSFCYLKLKQPDQAQHYYQRFTSSRTAP